MFALTRKSGCKIVRYRAQSEKEDRLPNVDNFSKTLADAGKCAGPQHCCQLSQGSDLEKRLDLIERLAVR